MTRRRRHVWRRIGAGAGAVVLFACIASAALVWSLLPPRHARVALPGLGAPVNIEFDADGIPFIRAGSPRDAAEALGYLHARDRLFEMDLMRRAAGGTLAELFGPVALANDEEMRRLGLRQSAQADAADLSPQARAMLQAYADGVNAYIAQRGRFAAPEFLLLGRPAPWTVTDSLLWGKVLSLWLSGNYRVEIARLALSTTLPLAKIFALWPPAESNLPAAASLAPSSELAAAADAALAGARKFPQAFTQPAQASNEWAVSGAHTVAGKPLLAGDPHLAFGFPSLWYLVRIDTPGATLAGATAPGVPFLVIGENGHIAWTFTSAGAAVQDVFIEHRTKDGGYATPTGSARFLTRTENIAVRGRPDVVLTVLSTRHGPVIGTTPDGKELLAVEMANFAPHDTDSDGLLALNNAQSVAAAAAAAALLTSPVQNLLTADAGNIGFFTTGRVPIRKAGDGTFPVDGADGLHDWTGMASGTALPHSVNPPSGELINTNNPTAGPDFPVFLGRDSFPDFRARRIRALLASPGLQSAASFGRIQMDITSDFAQRVLPRLLALDVPAHDPGAPVAGLLRGWPGDMAMDAPQPLIFNAWIDAFDDNILRRNGFDPDTAPMLPDSFALSLLGADAAPAVVKLWCGGNCGPALLAALQDATARLQRSYGANPASWRWGAAHLALFAHPLLGALPVIGGLGRLSIPAPGDATTVDVAAPGPTAPDPDGFTAIHGPELRAIFDLSDLNESEFVIAPGQSGDLLSSHAGDFLRRWRDGDYIKLGPGPVTVAATLELTP